MQEILAAPDDATPIASGRLRRLARPCIGAGTLTTAPMAGLMAVLTVTLALAPRPTAAQATPPSAAAVPLHARGYARPEMLISTDELAQRLGAPGLRLVDAADPAVYARAHLPGAVNLPYLDLSRRRHSHRFAAMPQRAK